MKAKVNKISDIDSRYPFTVPDGYFETLSDEMMSRLPEKEKEQSETIKVSLWTKAKPLVYMAAMFVGTFFFMKVAFKSSESIQPHTVGAGGTASQYVTSSDNYWSNVEVTEDEFYNYIEEQLASDGYYDYMFNQVSF